MIRRAEPEDLAFLPAIEVAAGEAFRALGMDEIADDLDRPVGYILVELIGDDAHIEQLSVNPDHARKGLGAGLIDAVALWATGEGIRALTLTTFRVVMRREPARRQALTP